MTALILASKTRHGKNVLQRIRSECPAWGGTCRHAQALGEFDRRRDPGLEWITDAVDLMERRKKILRLTDKGRRVVAQLQSAIGG